MKLKESKEKVPATFITSYISDAWDRVGYIKADIEAIKEQYTNTGVVIECLQDILDAYLIAAGRLQAFLDNKNYVNIPDEPVKESIAESITNEVSEDLNIDTANISIDEIEIEPEIEDATKPVFKPAAMQSNSKIAEPLTKPSGDEFEFSCDFDDPDLTQEDAEMASQIMQVCR